MSDIRKLLSSSIIVFIGTIVSGILSYLFNVKMGDLLQPALYGELTAAMSLFTVASVGTSAFTIITMRYVGQYYYAEEGRGLGNVVKKLFIYALGLAMILFLVGWALSGVIARSFQIESSTIVVISFAAFFTSLAMTVGRGIMQGTQQFWVASMSAIVEMIGRLGLGILFVKAGWGVQGALWAILIGSLVAYIATIPKTRSLLAKSKEVTGEETALSGKEVLTYTWPSLVMSLFLNVLLTADILLVKRYFPAVNAGEYAAVSTVAKIMFFLTGPIVSVMFPMITERRSKGERHYQMLFLSLLISLVMGGSLLLIYTIAPGLIMRTLYGDAYAAQAVLLPKVGMVMLVYALINLMANYFMAIKSYWYLVWMAVAAVVLPLWIAYDHRSIEQVISIMMVVMSGLFILVMGQYLYLKRDGIRALMLASQPVAGSNE